MPVLSHLTPLMAILALPHLAGAVPDWLVTSIEWPSKVERGELSLALTNGLVTRRFALHPGFHTEEFYSHEKRASLIRAMEPEV